VTSLTTLSAGLPPTQHWLTSDDLITFLGAYSSLFYALHVRLQYCNIIGSLAALLWFMLSSRQILFLVTLWYVVTVWWGLVTAQ
jgi:hypothetical protein